MSYVQKVIRVGVAVKLDDPDLARRKAADRLHIKKLSVFIREGGTAEARASAVGVVGVLTANFVRRYRERP